MKKITILLITILLTACSGIAGSSAGVFADNAIKESRKCQEGFKDDEKKLDQVK